LYFLITTSLQHAALKRLMLNFMTSRNFESWYIETMLFHHFFFNLQYHFFNNNNSRKTQVIAHYSLHLFFSMDACNCVIVHYIQTCDTCFFLPSFYAQHFPKQLCWLLKKTNIMMNPNKMNPNPPNKFKTPLWAWAHVYSPTLVWEFFENPTRVP